MPGLLGLLGATGAGLAVAPAFRVLTYPLLAVTAAMLGWGWFLAFQHPGRTRWQRRARAMLVLSTVLALALWSLRFGGLLGPSSF